MKSEPFRFSPTSAGVRIEHMNFNNSNANTSTNPSDKGDTDACNRNNNNFTFSLPRPRGSNPTLSSSSFHDKRNQFVELEQVIVQKGKPTKKEKQLGEKSGAKSNKMRNCCIVTGVVVLAGLLSFVLLVECRSVRVTSKKVSQYDEEVSSESRIQDASAQEPNSESSEEHPAKVVSTTGATKGSTSSSSSSPFPPKSTTTRATGRLTRTRVSVVCRGGYIGSGEGDSSKSTSSTTGKSQRRSIDLPTFLPRESDDVSGEGGQKNGWDDEDYSSEESQQHVVTLTGYSQVTGGKPQTKNLKGSSSTTKIRYIPKPSPTKETTKKDEDEDSEGSSSGEEVEVVKAKPKTKHRSSQREHRQDKSKGSKSSSSSSNNDHKSETISSVSSSSSKNHDDAPPTSRSSSSSHKKDKQSNKIRHSKRASSEEEEGGEESVEVPATSRPSRNRSSKSKGSSKRSENSQAKQVAPSTDKPEKNEKGDSSEFEDDELFPTLRKSERRSTERKQGNRKSQERKPKSPKVVPVVSTPLENPELESAEAEPLPVFRSKPEVVSTSNSRKSSKPKGGSMERKRDAPTPPIEESSEEYNLEETPMENNHKKGKTRRTSGTISSSLSSSHRSSRMRSGRTSAAPQMRTRMFTSLEEDDR